MLSNIINLTIDNLPMGPETNFLNMVLNRKDDA